MLFRPDRVPDQRQVFQLLTVCQRKEGGEGCKRVGVEDCINVYSGHRISLRFMVRSMKHNIGLEVGRECLLRVSRCGTY